MPSIGADPDALFLLRLRAFVDDGAAACGEDDSYVKINSNRILNLYVYIYNVPVHSLLVHCHFLQLVL